MTKKPPHCKHCGSNKHYSAFCFMRPRPRITSTGKIYYKMAEVREQWFEVNLPDDQGHYHCYLRISPFCPFKMTKEHTTLDHIKARSNRQDLRFVFENLMPACSYCNVLKGSRSLEALSIEYPHLRSFAKELYA